MRNRLQQERTCRHGSILNDVCPASTAPLNLPKEVLPQEQAMAEQTDALHTEMSNMANDSGARMKLEKIGGDMKGERGSGKEAMGETLAGYIVQHLLLG